MGSHRSMSMHRRKARTRLSVSNSLREAIDVERGKLLKAESLLNCLATSMHADGEPRTSTHYPDVAEVACDLIRQSVDGLDIVSLERSIRGNKIKEDEVRSSTLYGLALTHDVHHSFLEYAS